jgi:hypothetical protein
VYADRIAVALTLAERDCINAGTPSARHRGHSIR